MRKSRGMSSRPWARLAYQIKVRDEWKCVKCGKPGRMEVDHVIPIWNGGTDDEANLQTLCRGCHIDKSRGEVYNRKQVYAAGYAELVEALK